MNLTYHIFILAVLAITNSFSASLPPPNKRVRLYDNVPLAETDRVIETFPDEEDFVSRRDPLVGAVLRNVGKVDMENDRYTPVLRGNMTTELTPWGNIELAGVMARSSRRIVFIVKNVTQFAIMYEHDCMPEGAWSTPVHPLISRLVYTRAAGDISGHPKILFISPPAPFNPSYKTMFEMSREQFMSCYIGGTTVRYSVISLVVAHKQAAYTNVLNSLEASIVDPRQRYSQLFHLGARLVLTIQKLHARQVLHGALTLDDIYASQKGVHGDHIHFYVNGFYSAAWIDPDTGASNRNQLASGQPSPRNLVWQSPWELKNGTAHMYSIRDEVFRVVEIIAQTINIRPDRRHEMLRDGTLHDYKVNGDIFDMRFLDHVKDARTKRAITIRIFSLKKLIRDESTILPNYNLIANELFKITMLLKGSHEWEFL